MKLPRDGRDGRDGKRGPDGRQGPQGPIPKHQIKDDKIRFQLLNGWGEWINLKAIDGVDGRDGRDGKDGIDGKDGKSVTISDVLPLILDKISEIPIPKDGKDGFDGKRGPRGVKGDPGRDGEDGLSAYDLWIKDGHQGSINDFFDWLADKVIDRIKKLFPYIFNVNTGGGSGGAIRLTGGFGFTLNTRDGNPITSDHQGFITVPYDMKITEWTILGDVPGSAVIDIWVSNYESAMPTDSNSITGDLPLIVSSSRKAKSSDLEGWSINLKAGHVMIVNVDSSSNFRNLTIGLKGRRF